MAIRWGILGCARISRRGLIPGIRGSANGRLEAIASRDPATARAWADEFQIPRHFGSYDDLIADPNIDAVYIPLPNELHCPWTFAAADAGKHVLCEKPLALDAAEATAMVEHCRVRRVVLMEAFMWRHQPRTLELVRRVRDGALGELRLIRSSFSFPIDPGDWRLDPSRGGGAFYDVGCYGLSTARLFAGSETTDIKSLAHFGPTGVDMSFTATLRFPGGVLAQIDCSFEQPFRCTYELVGSLGTLTVPDAYSPPLRPVAHLVREGRAEELSFDGRDQFACMVDAFGRAVADGGPLTFPAEDGLAQMTALETTLHVASGR
jgi:predicted dehydrogenase